MIIELLIWAQYFAPWSYRREFRRHCTRFHISWKPWPMLFISCCPLWCNKLLFL